MKGRPRPRRAKVRRATHRPVTAAGFPVLAGLCRGYLHEDFLEEHGSPTAALRCFRADASREERELAAVEWGRFWSRARNLSLERLRRVLAEAFGSAWRPRSRAELTAVFDVLREP